MDQRYVSDDSYISNKLESHNISSDIITNVISLISPIRETNKYKHLNLDYLTVSCYSLLINNMQINTENITKLENTMIKSNDKDNSCKALIRYAKYILITHNYPI